MSELFGRTLRTAPAEADSDNHKLLLRAGLIMQLSAGVYSYLPLAWRALRKIEAIIRDEMDNAGGQELMMPALQPLELWQETGRAEAYGPVLFRLQDRRERQYVLAPTHEEAVTDLVRRSVQSYRDLPRRLYQIQTKFRDEPRPRGGLVRVRQFTMKDAYSFDIDDEGFQRSYQAMHQAYTNIFARCGVPSVPVAADSGAIGGKISEEFVFLTDVGEDTVVRCPRCHYAANSERAELHRGEPDAEEPLPLAEIATPGITTIRDLAAFLRLSTRQTLKVVFYMADGRPVIAALRGDLDVNERKLSNALNAVDVRPMTDAEVEEASWTAGFASPLGLEGVRVVADVSVESASNLVAGANKADTHLRNVNYGRDWQADSVADIGLAREGDPCPRCQTPLTLTRGMELGHLFSLGTIYTEKMEASFLDAQGESRRPVMGCYGIGVERLLAAAIEANHDERGIRWPASLAPYHVHIVGINWENAEVRAAAEAAERDLGAAGLDVLTDDRDERPGVKFNDADLLGMPLRLTISPRNLKASVVELKRRDEDTAVTMPASELTPAVRKALASDPSGAAVV